MTKTLTQKIKTVGKTIGATVGALILGSGVCQVGAELVGLNDGMKYNRADVKIKKSVDYTSIMGEPRTKYLGITRRGNTISFNSKQGSQDIEVGDCQRVYTHKAPGFPSKQDTACYGTLAKSEPIECF